MQPVHPASPSPTPAAATGQLAYVIQHHTGSLLDHFDLMFEESPAAPLLRTFQLYDAPTPVQAARGMSCSELTPHRRDYLTREGEISGGRGRVAIWDGGTLRLRVLNPRQMELELTSARGKGTARWVLHFQGGRTWYLLAGAQPAGDPGVSSAAAGRASA